VTVTIPKVSSTDVANGLAAAGNWFMQGTIATGFGELGYPVPPELQPSPPVLQAPAQSPASGPMSLESSVLNVPGVGNVNVMLPAGGSTLAPGWVPVVTSSGDITVVKLPPGATGLAPDAILQGLDQNGQPVFCHLATCGAGPEQAPPAEPVTPADSPPASPGPGTQPPDGGSGPGKQGQLDQPPNTQVVTTTVAPATRAGDTSGAAVSADAAAAAGPGTTPALTAGDDESGQVIVAQGVGGADASAADATLVQMAGSDPQDMMSSDPTSIDV
jgi:hypothetical protein